ncbi:HI0074 family nucleotidyltransferase substrate-binding subunit [Megasphaera sp.]|uniref:HI0074 family nucleotidyltransferase substrate-binding subunit n=1 Tax=Megasphaera sp. TaxID=2023260 RepID=UPI001D6DA8BB|nr:HI0074 family nucleotidyltransferase substrate-binding subunit [Megasphaera sp.]MBS6103992.1 HI0074 family nucleotidyltransferase substrate-binding subunit [Megasphaera sp.]
MERITERYRLAVRALGKFHELASRDTLNEIERDALIQRFEFSFELIWKCAKEYLYVQDGIDAASPKKVIRACRETGLLSEAETEQALKMVDDRNLTTHTYDEAFVVSLIGRFPEYDAVMHSWLEKLK